jgi:hypothetical protein
MDCVVVMCRVIVALLARESSPARDAKERRMVGVVRREVVIGSLGYDGRFEL